VDVHPPYNALLSIDRVADQKAYSVKRGQGDGQLIAGPAHDLIWASTLPC
jgi:hypothetical protein